MQDVPTFIWDICRQTKSPRTPCLYFPQKQRPHWSAFGQNQLLPMVWQRTAVFEIWRKRMDHGLRRLALDIDRVIIILALLLFLEPARQDSTELHGSPAVSESESVPVDWKDHRVVSRLCRRPPGAAQERGRGSSFQHAVADQGNRAGEGSVGVMVGG